MDTPDITKAQLVAIVQAILGVLVAFGVPITDAQSIALIALVGVVGAVLIRGDASIREARNFRAATEPPPDVVGPDEVAPDDADDDTVGEPLDTLDASAEV